MEVIVAIIGPLALVALITAVKRCLNSNKYEKPEEIKNIPLDAVSIQKNRVTETSWDNSSYYIKRDTMASYYRYSLPSVTSSPRTLNKDYPKIISKAKTEQDIKARAAMYNEALNYEAEIVKETSPADKNKKSVKFAGHKSISVMSDGESCKTTFSHQLKGKTLDKLVNGTRLSRQSSVPLIGDFYISGIPQNRRRLSDGLIARFSEFSN
jgi:hypothetical protein